MEKGRALKTQGWPLLLSQYIRGLA
nr:hypothetical protein SHINE37_44159 [Rhizobiaceae bacterium]